MVARLSRLGGVILLVALCAPIAGCLKHEPQQQAAAPAPPRPTEVLFDLPTTGTITDYEDFTGRTVAIRNIELRARVTG